MMIEKRANEIYSQITAFTNEAYSKSEALAEKLKLQKELIDLTFNAEHAENSELRLWDVERHLRKMNEARGYVADDELEKFMKGSKEICNSISSDISGNAGEQKVFRALENLSCQNGVLRNVELEFDGRRTEIDAIVFTNRAIFIIEIKNSKKNMFIDEDGELYRIGNSMHHDDNLAEKMNDREAFLRRALERAGMDYLKIFKIVTFTNPRIDVENKYHYIKVCPCNYLTSFLEKFTSSQWYTYENICTMMAAVNEVKCSDEYKMSIDMDEFKRNFSVLMAKLEAAEEGNMTESVVEFTEKPERHYAKNNKPTIRQPKPTHKLGKGMVAAAIGLTVVNVALISISRLIKK